MRPGPSSAYPHNHRQIMAKSNFVGKSDLGVEITLYLGEAVRLISAMAREPSLPANGKSGSELDGSFGWKVQLGPFSPKLRQGLGQDARRRPEDNHGHHSADQDVRPRGCKSRDTPG